jgi:hypothetical protein
MQTDPDIYLKDPLLIRGLSHIKKEEKKEVSRSSKNKPQINKAIKKKVMDSCSSDSDSDSS